MSWPREIIPIARNAPLRVSARCQVGSITCSEDAGNLRIAWTIDPACTIVIERGDIDDLMTALTEARSDRLGKSVQVGSMVVIRNAYQLHGHGPVVIRSWVQGLTISKSHTPQDNLGIGADQVDDLVVALDGILGQRETLPVSPHGVL